MEDWVIARFTPTRIEFLDRRSALATDLPNARRLSEVAARRMAFTEWSGYPLSYTDAAKTIAAFDKLRDGALD